MDQQDVFQMAALLLTYPEADWFVTELEDVKSWIGATKDTEPSTRYLKEAVSTLAGTPNAVLTREYVDTFDFDEKRALYLTAHEYGDKRERGTALVELRQLLMKSGYEEIEGELPDYLPLLLEFLAENPDAGRELDLQGRIRQVCRTIVEHLLENSPYQSVFAALLEVLPEAMAGAVPEARNLIDEEVPYPITFE